MKKDIIHLTIAGIHIQVIFGEIDWLGARSNFINEIQSNFSPFITNIKKNSSIDYRIRVKELPQTWVLYKKDPTTAFIELYRKPSNNEFITFYHISISHFQFILRKILLDNLVKTHGLLLHGSASNINGKSYVFIGPNGGGKSTLISLLHPEMPALADDTGILKLTGAGVQFYQTPFIEKNAWIPKQLDPYPLGKIFFIKKSSKMAVWKIDRSDIIINTITKHLITERGYSESHMKHVLSLVDSFHEWYYLFFPKNKKTVLDFIEANRSFFS